MAGLRKQTLLVGPNVCCGHVEAEDPTLQAFDAASEPFLKPRSGGTFFCSNPVSNSSDDNRACVAIVLLTLQPFDDYAISTRLHWLTEHVGIHEPAHNFSFLGVSRLRAATSSIGTGHCFQISSHFVLRLIRRKVTTSSSASNLASNWSPGAAGAKAAEIVNRRLLSSVTIMVGLSHHQSALSKPSEGPARASPHPFRRIDLGLVKLGLPESHPFLHCSEAGALHFAIPEHAQARTYGEQMLYCHKSRVNQAGATKEQTDLELASHASEASPVPAAVAAIGPGDKLVTDHELVRRIGRGSYGEVWLARNVIGTYRAVKIVFRAQFENEQPYEREFKGIQRFEPVSRSHEGFVDILQIGRNDQRGCFYYVMELADGDEAERSNGVAECWSNEKAKENQLPSPASQNPGPLSTHHSNTPPLHRSTSSYLPKTLRSELRRRGRLPVDECVNIGLTLTSALECLHKGGLVHRDIKPSNIIFVKGVPKLADIGLVADMSEAKSFVGTAGFIPPEGPGAPSADLYSLGKVFYEMSTGRDRQDFPQLPVDLREYPNPEALVEFNEILLKACESEPKRRYQSAAEMRADLDLLLRGQSVRRKRALQRIYSLSKKTSLAVSAVALVGVLAVSIINRPPDSYAHSAIQEVNDLVEQGDHCLDGRASDRVDQAVAYYNRAIELDPRFVPAYAGLFRASIGRGGMEEDASADVRRNFRAAASKLAAIAPSYAEAKTATATVRWIDWQFPEALADARSATKMRAASREGRGLAHLAYGFLLLQTAHPDAAQEQYQMAEKLLPSNATIHHHLGHPYFVKHDFKHALEHYQKSLELEPRQDIGHQWKARVFVETGDFMGAIHEWEQSEQAVGAFNAERKIFYDRLRDAVRRDGSKGYWTESLDLAKGKSPQNPYLIASYYARLGQWTNAYAYLNRACEQHSFTEGLMFDLCWDHNDPQFQAIARRIGLLQPEKAN